MLEAQIYIKKHFKTEKIGGGACRLPFWKVFTPPLLGKVYKYHWKRGRPDIAF